MFQLFAEITECRCITITRLVDRLIGEISSLKRAGTYSYHDRFPRWTYKRDVLIYFAWILTEYTETFGRVYSLMTEYIVEAYSGIPMATYSSMLARRHRADEERYALMMRRAILGSKRWNLVSATVSFPALTRRYTRGTNQCFLMNYVGSVCETEFRRPRSNTGKLSLCFPNCG